MQNNIGSSMTKEPLTIGPNVNVREAQDVMQMWGMRHLPVTNDLGALVGIISDRDIAKSFAAGLSGTLPVSEIMVKNPYSVSSSTPIAKVAETMADHKYGCAVVTNSAQKVVGIFTTVDALNVLAHLLREPAGFDFRVLKIEDYFKNFQNVV